ncbi:hypothetical protein MVES_002314 [Malassezia vespertilionis]|uniref:DUF4042 domain-containing protein n=1 Tax=Malassezia vespertilionis TaxID=2020962 RepID=A0A2N1JAW3_9BASI|nr:hypothetical protein MVES_002314 [Malassezia vespertilionis]
MPSAASRGQAPSICAEVSALLGTDLAPAKHVDFLLAILEYVRANTVPCASQARRAAKICARALRDEQGARVAQESIPRAMAHWAKEKLAAIPSTAGDVLALQCTTYALAACVPTEDPGPVVVHAVDHYIWLLMRSIALTDHIHVRLKSLMLLRFLCIANAKDVVAWWPELIPVQHTHSGLRAVLSDKDWDVQRAACETLSALFLHGKKFWEVAREHAKTGAFTSHSELLASMLVQMRATLAELLEAPDTHHIAILELTRDFLTAAARPLQATHASVLWTPVLGCVVEGKGEEEILAGYQCAVLLFPSRESLETDPSLAATPPMGEVSPGMVAEQGMHWVFSCLNANDRTTARLGDCLWTVGAAILSRINVLIPPDMVGLLSRDLGNGSSEQRLGVMTFISALVGQKERQENSSTLRVMLPRLVASVIRDKNADVRVGVCALWPDFDMYMAPGSSPLHLAHMHVLMRDPNSHVRAAAVRAVGTRLDKSRNMDTETCIALLDTFTYESMTRLLHARKPHGLLNDKDLCVRACAAWTLSNYADLIARAHIGNGAGRSLIATVANLPKDERVAVHTIRALGVLLVLGVEREWLAVDHTPGTAPSSCYEPQAPGVTLAPVTPPNLAAPNLMSSSTPLVSGDASPQRKPVEFQTMFSRGIEAACTALKTARLPKLRWNAASCLAKAVDAACRAKLHGVDSRIQDAVLALAQALGDRNCKVVRIAAQALSDLMHASDAPSLEPDTTTFLSDRVLQALEEMQARFERASFTEMQQHGKACTQAIEMLHALLEEKPLLTPPESKTGDSPLASR